MRYYDISITQQGSTTPLLSFTSHPGGVADPGALNVEFDMPFLAYGTPNGGQTLRIEGVPLQILQQSYQLASQPENNKYTFITMKGGMQAGLPLNNPAQAGIILQGMIFQAYGNWQGTDMSLDLVILPAQFTLDNPGNFVLHWDKGVQLSTALQQCLSTAYPSLQISINIGSQYVNNSGVGYHTAATLDELSAWLFDFTDTNFQSPVSIAIQKNVVMVYDKSYNPSPTVQLNFNDFLGQPTWVNVNQLQINTVMRADIQIGTIITLPSGLQNAPGFVTTTAASLPSSLKYQSSFQGNFQVIGVRMIGNFRSSDSTNWSTIITCVPNVSQ